MALTHHNATVVLSAMSSKGKYFTSAFTFSKSVNLLLDVLLLALTPLLVGIPALSYMSRHGYFGFRHRKILYKMMELLVLSQLLIATANLDPLSTLVCNPDLLYALFKGDWTGSTECHLMPLHERMVLDCDDWATRLRDLIVVMAVFSGALTFCTVWVFVFEERAPSDSLRRMSSCLLLGNAVLWLVYYCMDMWVWYDGMCRVSLGSHATGVLFYVLSIVMPLFEWYVPDTPDVHSADSLMEMGTMDATDKATGRYGNGEAGAVPAKSGAPLAPVVDAAQQTAGSWEVSARTHPIPGAVFEDP